MRSPKSIPRLIAKINYYHTFARSFIICNHVVNIRNCIVFILTKIGVDIRDLDVWKKESDFRFTVIFNKFEVELLND